MNELRIYVPDDWRDITVGQFREYRKQLLAGNWTETQIKVMACSIFCREPVHVIQSLSIKSLNDVFVRIMELIERPAIGDLESIISLKGVKYGFHPSLNEMSTGEWADLDSFISDADDIWEIMPEILSILYRPITRLKRWKFIGLVPRRFVRYSIEDYSPKHVESCDVFNEMDMVTANSVSVFFWNIAGAFLLNSQKSIQDRMNRMNKTIEKTSEKLILEHGVGLMESKPYHNLN